MLARRICKAALFGVVYFACARLSLGLVVEPEQVAAFWPPSGLLLAFLCLEPPKNWPLILAFFVPANLVPNLLVGNPLSLSLAFSFANGLDAVVGASLMLWLAGRPLDLGGLRQVLLFLALPVMSSSALSASIGSLATMFWGVGPRTSFSWVWLVWFASNAVGILVVAPVILTLPRLSHRRDWPLRRVGEAAVLFTTVALFSFAALGWWSAPTGRVHVLPYFAFPLLVWAALRFGTAGAASASMIVSVAAALAASHGRGPFAMTVADSPEAHLLAIQLYVAVGAASTLLIAALLAERERAARALRESQAQLFHAQKLEILGQFAAGIAHDFNNLLMAMMSYAELVQDSTEAPQVRADLEQIAAAGRRGSALTRRLLAFARRERVDPVSLSLNELALRSTKLLRRVIGREIELNVKTDPGLWMTKADPAQLEQVIINLVVNARDAISGRGSIELKTENVPGDAQGGTSAGDFVCLEVSDSGLGMTSEVLSRVFEPFFTTKSNGTGLGLATVRAIVIELGGNVSVESTPGRGTSFRVCLPRSKDVEVKEQPLTAGGEPWQGTETILLVDDDGPVLEATARNLRKLGYRVITASNGAEALLRLDADDAPVDLLLTDVAMPGVNGQDLAHQLLASRRVKRVLFMSGLSDLAVPKEASGNRGDWIWKPFGTEALARAVRTSLDAGPSDGPFEDLAIGPSG